MHRTLYITLARAGFFYVPNLDKVRCNFCRLTVSWQISGVLRDHSRFSPTCPAHTQLDTNLREGSVLNDTTNLLSSETLDPLPVLSIDSTTTNILNDILKCEEAANNELFYINNTVPNSKRKRPIFPAFRYLAKRLNTFTHWPIAVNQTPQELSDAGFFYTQYGDRVKCFYCGDALQAWSHGCDPWQEHAFWFIFVHI